MYTLSLCAACMIIFSTLSHIQYVYSVIVCSVHDYYVLYSLSHVLYTIYNRVSHFRGFQFFKWVSMTKNSYPIKDQRKKYFSDFRGKFTSLGLLESLNLLTFFRYLFWILKYWSLFIFRVFLTVILLIEKKICQFFAVQSYAPPLFRTVRIF